MQFVDSAKRTKQIEVPWSVFVAFDDLAARHRATGVCDFLTAQFWPAIEFELHWCPLERLGSAECAAKAIACATSARIIILASSAQSELPETTLRWLEDWCLRRHGREGALIGLVEAVEHCERAMRLDHFFRQLAHRAGLDYLTHAPATGLTPMQDESGWITEKAEGMSSVLQGILTKPIVPPTADFRRLAG